MKNERAGGVSHSIGGGMRASADGRASIARRGPDMNRRHVQGPACKTPQIPDSLCKSATDPSEQRR